MTSVWHDVRLFLCIRRNISFLDSLGAVVSVVLVMVYDV